MNNNSSKKQTVSISKIKWTLWDKITMPFYVVRNSFRNKLQKIRQGCQRFKRGFASEDVWGIDTWFISTIRPMLDHLLENHCGNPYTIDNEKWEAILQEMIDCLELMNEEEARDYLGIMNEDYSLESSKKIGELMNLKKDRFFELFSKWFYDLWD